MFGPKTEITKINNKVHNNLGKLPQIAIISDSITSDFAVSSYIDMFRNMWGNKKGNWFLETDKDKKINSIFERLNGKSEILLKQYSTPGAGIMIKNRSILDIFLNRKHIGIQINELLQSSSFPDLLLIWGGHDALNWTRYPNLKEDELCNKFYNNFKIELERLCKRANTQNTTIIVFGFLNLKPLFRFRKLINEKRKIDKNIYPYFERANNGFKAINPVNSERTLKLTNKMNKILEKLVKSLSKEYSNKRFKIIYSDVFSKAETDSIDSVSLSDGWHPSIYGQRKIAEAGWPIIKKEVEKIIKKKL